MKKIFTLFSVVSLAATGLFLLGNMSQNSFSQEIKVKIDSIDSSAATRNKRVSQTDTNYLNQILQMKYESVRNEHKKSTEITQQGKEVIGTQKTNRSNLRQASVILKKSLKLAKTEEFSLPPIELIHAKKKPLPLPVNIEPVECDSIIIPKKREGFFKFFKFKRK